MTALTINQTATKLGVHPDTVRAWIKKGLLKSYRIGTRYRIEEKTIAAFVRANQVKTKG